MYFSKIFKDSCTENWGTTEKIENFSILKIERTYPKYYVTVLTVFFLVEKKIKAIFYIFLCMKNVHTRKALAKFANALPPYPLVELTAFRRASFGLLCHLVGQ